MISRDERRKERRQIASEFLEFRRRYLYRQIDLATALEISRRSVQMHEAGLVLPNLRTRARFLELKKRHNTEAA